MRSQPTRAEQHLWSALRNDELGCRFRRQSPFRAYILDFVSIPARLVVEVDGDSHLTDEEIEADAARDEVLRTAGFTVLRFTNEQVVADLDGVIEDIRAAVQAGLLAPSLSKSSPPKSSP